MKLIKQKIALLSLVILNFSCNSSRDEGLQSPPVSDPGIAKWTHLSTNSPAMQGEYAMVYDTRHHEIIAYGGRTGFSTDFQNIDETWAFDYQSRIWTNLEPIISPPWRANHTMVYDPLRHKALMFGGTNFNQVFNDIWEYDYDQNTWIELSPANSPEPRQMHGMVYIPNQDIIMMFGGRRNGGGASFNDSWKYSYTSNEWQEFFPSNSPPFQDHVNITYDTSSNKVILYAGPVSGSRPKTWAYDFDSNSWTNLNPVHLPDSDHSSLVYDPFHEKSILLGNSPGSNDMLTWAFNYSENSWTNITPQSMPDVYIEHAAMVYINDHNAFIQYGGCCSNKTLELILNK